MNLPLATTMIPLIGAVFAGLVVGWVLPDPWRSRSKKGYIVPPDRGETGSGSKESAASLRERAELAEREAEMLQSQLHSLRAAQRAHADREGYGEEDGPSEFEQMQERLAAAERDRDEFEQRIEELQNKARQQQRKLDEAADRLVEFERERMKKGEGFGRRSAPKPESPAEDDRPAKWVEPLMAATKATRDASVETPPHMPDLAEVTVAVADPPVDLELERDEVELRSGFAEPLATPDEPVALEIQRSELLTVSTDAEEEMAVEPAEDPAAPPPEPEELADEAPVDMPELEIDDDFEAPEIEEPVEAQAEPVAAAEVQEPEASTSAAEVTPEAAAEETSEASTSAAEVAPEVPEEPLADSPAAPTPEPTEMGASHPLSAIDGLKTDVIERLGLIGVKSTLDLVRKGAKRSGVNGLASGMSLSPSEIEKWVSAADLLRVERMRHQDVGDLVAKNITSVKVLAEIDPQKLVDRLESAGNNATLKVAEEWIGQASKLMPIIRW